MVQTEKIVGAIFRAIDEFNLALPEEQKLDKSAATVLFGRSGKLDSLALVNLIVAVEAQLEEDLGTGVILADERAVSQKHSPFRTVGTLAEYIAKVLDHEPHGEGRTGMLQSSHGVEHGPGSNHSDYRHK